MNQTNGERVLLISNSTLYGSGYLDHAESEIRSFLGTVGRVLFVPFALYDRDAYASTTRERFQKMGYAICQARNVRRSSRGGQCGQARGGNKSSG